MWAYERAAVDVSPNQACEPRRHEYVHFVHPGNGRSSAAEKSTSGRGTKIETTRVVR